MKCDKCNEKWEAPAGRSHSFCPNCGNKVATESVAVGIDSTESALHYIAKTLGADALLGSKSATYFADVTRNRLKDEKDLIKILQERGALDCIKEAMQKSENEQEMAIKHAISKLPKFLQNSEDTVAILCGFAAALGWKITMPKPARSKQTVQAQALVTPKPAIGSIHEFAGIDWRVLDDQGFQALLISEKILEIRPFNNFSTGITWATCTLRDYLNEEFYNRLGKDKTRISERRIETKNSSPITDNVFLLSVAEANIYFKNDYARIAKCVDKSSWWWLRSPGTSGNYAAFVNDDGKLTSARVSEDGGVRPALWLNLQSEII